MYRQSMTLDELYMRNPNETPEDYRCAVCEQLISTSIIWTCDDHDLNAADQLVCNAFYFCATCAIDEVAIRQVIRETAAEYDGEDDAHAAALRRMAESPLVSAAEA